MLKVVGVIHLLPLPGTPRGVDFEDVLIRALDDARALKIGGVDTAILENFGDAPFVRASVEPHIASMMTRIALEIRLNVDLRLGINVLRNDAKTALAIAETVGAEFIRINVHTGAAWTDQGLIQGDAYETLQYRKKLNSSVRIVADVFVKHAKEAGNRTLIDAAKDTLYRGLADALILTGTATGSSVSWEDVQALKRTLPEVPIWIGSGINVNNLPQAKQFADVVIVGTYFHSEGRIDLPLEVSRIECFMNSVNR